MQKRYRKARMAGSKRYPARVELARTEYIASTGTHGKRGYRPGYSRRVHVVSWVAGDDLSIPAGKLVLLAPAEKKEVLAWWKQTRQAIARDNLIADLHYAAASIRTTTREVAVVLAGEPDPVIGQAVDEIVRAARALAELPAKKAPAKKAPAKKAPAKKAPAKKAPAKKAPAKKAPAKKAPARAGH